MPITPEIIGKYKRELGANQVLTTEADLLLYSYDSGLDRARPEAVLLPTTAEQVRSAVQICLRHKVPYVARGAGTNLSGGCVPLRGGVILSTARMQRILSIDTSQAEKLEGVHAVLTADKIDNVPFGHGRDNTPLKGDRVRCIRDEIAAVAAESEAIAREACSRGLALVRAETGAAMGSAAKRLPARWREPHDLVRDETPVFRQAWALSSDPQHAAAIRPQPSGLCHRASPTP